MDGIKRTTREKEADLRINLQKGSEEGVVALYTQYRREFFDWAGLHYKLGPDTCADVFQDAVISLFIQAKGGRLNQLNCSIKTYLFAIGKNMALKHLHKKKKQEQPQFEAIAALADETYESTQEPMEQREQVVAQVLGKLGEPCKSILRLFYFNALSMAEIARELRYKNENVVKSQKLRCLNEVKRQVKERIQKEL